VLAKLTGPPVVALVLNAVLAGSVAVVLVSGSTSLSLFLVIALAATAGFAISGSV